MGAAHSLRELGIGGALSYALLRLAAAVPGLRYRRYRLIAVPRSGLPAMPRDYVAVPVADHDPRLRALGITAAAEAHRRAQGMTCVGVERAGELVAVNWLTTAPFVEDEVAVRFLTPVAAAWDTGLMIAEAARGSRAFAAIWAASAAWLDVQRCGWSLSRIADYNRASWAAHRRMGGQEIGTLTSLGMGPVILTWGAVQRWSRADAVIDVPLTVPAAR